MEGREGTFSSSSIHKLVKSGRGKDAVFSAAGLTYIKEKKLRDPIRSSTRNRTIFKGYKLGSRC